MPKAIVTKPFKGRPDNSPQTRQYNKGDEIEGDLARVAVEELESADWKGKPAKRRGKGATHVESRTFEDSETVKVPAADDSKESAKTETD